MSTAKPPRDDKVAQIVIGLVLALCLIAIVLMLVLPVTSLKVDAVYQKF
jgi:hypothetical protein